MGSTDLRERARRERIRILLRTRNDPYSNIRAKATPYTTAGPAPGRKQRCPVCDGTGKTRLRQKCQACDGLKSIAVDSYTGRVSDAQDRKPQPMTPERRESEIQRLQSALTISAGETDPNEAYGWERAVETRNKQGSYRELDRALEWLRSHDPLGWEFITWVYGSGLEVELSPYAKLREDSYVGQLSRHMPSMIRLPKHLHTSLMDAKRETVRELLKRGVTREEVAALVLLPLRVLERWA